MPSPRSASEADRAVAVGALIRRRRRESSLTIGALAAQIPMSASTLSRVELGSQRLPSDETLGRLAAVLELDPDELQRAAGRVPTGQSFEEQVLARLEEIGRDLRAVKAAVLDRPG